MQFTYARAEAALARLHEATGEIQQKAFRGRLQHLRRLGIPRGVNPGRGKKVLYDLAHVYEWAFCLELAEFGIDPSVIVRFMERHWADDILPRFLLAQRSRGQPANETYFVAHPQFVADAWTADPGTILRFRWIKAVGDRGHPEGAAWMLRMTQRNRRALLINVSSLVREIIDAEE